MNLKFVSPGSGQEEEEDPDSSGMDDSSNVDSDSDLDTSSEDGDAEAGKAEEEDEEDEEDEVLQSIRQAKEKKKANHPPDLDLSPHTPSCMSFHQTQDLLGVATFDGDLRLYGYSDEANTLKSSVSLRESTICREIAFTEDGEKVLLAANWNDENDIVVFDIEQELKEVRRLKGATREATGRKLRINSEFSKCSISISFCPCSAAVSCLYSIDENTFATGDDDGHVCLWDVRSSSPKCYASLKVSEDCISGMVTNQEKRLLACTSTDGSLFSVRIRGGKVQTESEVYDNEFNCVSLFKQESKLAVGSGNGSVYIFNWNEFGKHADIYTGIGKKKEPINAVIPITERIILTGGEDGCIRATNFYPQKYLGLVGQVGYSIEKMDVCNDGHLIASLGSDEEVIKFWNVSYFEGMTIGEGEKSKQFKNKSKPVAGEGDKRGNLPSSSKQNASDFFKGLA